MTDFAFPEGVYPFEVDFYFQSHSGGSESPFTRTTKTYVLSGGRWVCRMRFRTAWDEASDQAAGSPIPEWQGKLSAFIDRLQGRAHRALLWDVRREQLGSTLTNEAISIGDTTVMVSGGVPKVGGYIGGDGRPHRIVAVTSAGGTSYQCEVVPPFRDYVSAGGAEFERVTGRFMLTSDDAAASASGVSQPAVYELEFVEDLNYFHPATLFGSSDSGYLLDFLNPSNLGRTTGFTSPVTALGQTIGQVRDLTGQGNHAGNSDADERPTWEEAPNGLKGAYFNGVDQFLYLATSIFNSSAASTFIACVQCVANDSGVSQIVFGEGGSSTGAQFYVGTGTGRSNAQNSDGPAKLRHGIRNNAATSSTIDTYEAFADDNPRIIVLRDQSPSPEMKIDNRDTAHTTTFGTFSTTRAGAFTLDKFTLGALQTTSTPTGHFEGWIFGVFGIDRALTDSELDKVRAWMAERYYTPVRLAEGVQTLPVIPKGTWFHGRPLVAAISQTAGVRITDLGWDGNFRGRAYSPWSMGAIAGDAHSAPAALTLSDGRLVMAWTPFSADNNNAFIRVTNGDSLDPLDWETTRNFGSEMGQEAYTYASLVELALGVFYFSRARTAAETSDQMGFWYSHASDPSDTFPTATKILAGDRPYVMHAKNGPYRVDFLVATGNPSEQPTNSMYHFYMAINPSTDAITFHKSDGSSVSTPAVVGDLTLIYDGTSAPAWIEDIAIGPDGYPRVIYVVYNDPDTPGDYTYHYGRWTGSAWVTAPIADGGATTIPDNFIANGNAAIDPEDVNTVIACCLPDGGTVLQAMRYTSEDNGLTWTLETQLTDEEEQVWGPSFIYGAPEPRALVTVGPFNDVGGAFVGDTRIKLMNSVTGEYE